MGCGASKATADTAVTTAEKPTQMKEVKKDHETGTRQHTPPTVDIKST